MSLVELIINSYLHQERKLSSWLEGESEENESALRTGPREEFTWNYFQILICVALHTLRHEFSWQPHSFTHHAFAARVPIFPRNRLRISWQLLPWSLLLQALSDHCKRNNLFHLEGMECYFRIYYWPPLTIFIRASMTSWNYFNSALGEGTSQFSKVSPWQKKYHGIA